MTKSAIQLAKERLQKKFKNSSIGTMGEGAISDVDTGISTGLPVIDNFLIGCGGLPVKRVVEIYGHESSCKTSFVLQCIAAAQRAGYNTALFETEDCLETKRAHVFGLDSDEVLLAQPDYLEEFFAQVEETLKCFAENSTPSLIALDSIAATPTAAEVKEGLGGSAGMAEKARILSKYMPQITSLVKKSNSCLLLVNQTRQEVGKMFGNPTTTPGGAAVKFASSLRIQMYGGSAIKKGDDKIGQRVLFVNTKNKVGMPWRKAEVEFYYDTGWDNTYSVIALAKKLKLVTKGTRKSKGSAEEALELLKNSEWGKIKGTIKDEDEDTGIDLDEFEESENEE